MDVCPTCMINVTVNVRTDHVTKVWLCSLGDFELQTKFAKFMTGEGRIWNSKTLAFKLSQFFSAKYRIIPVFKCRTFSTSDFGNVENSTLRLGKGLTLWEPGVELTYCLAVCLGISDLS